MKRSRMFWIAVAIACATNVLANGQAVEYPTSAPAASTSGSATPESAQRDFQMIPAEGWRDSMLLCSTPWGLGTTMYPQMPAWKVPDDGIFYIRLNPEKVSRLDPPPSEVDRISWVVNPPSEDLAAVTLSDYFIRGPYHWYQSIDFNGHGGQAGAKVVQSVSGTVFFKDGHTTGIKGNLLGPDEVTAPPSSNAPNASSGQKGPSKFPKGK